jgi:hypothetical protein
MKKFYLLSACFVILSLSSVLAFDFAVDSTGNVGLDTSIAIGTDGFARISYYDSSNLDLKYARCTNSHCTSKVITTVDSTGTVGLYTSIAIGTDGFARISYFDSTNADLKMALCLNDDCTSSQLTTIANGGRFSSIVMGTDGFPRISFEDGVDGNIRYAQCTNANCSTNVLTTIESSGFVETYTSIDLGTDGFARISYRDGSANLKHTRCTNDACTTRNITTPDASGNIASYLSLEVGEDDFSRISYSAGNVLKYLACDDEICSSSNKTIIDSGYGAGYYHSLALGSDGFARISYFGINVLGYAQCNNKNCVNPLLVTLNSTAGFGYFTSIAMGSDNFSRISFYDSVNDDLRYAIYGDDYDYISYMIDTKPVTASICFTDGPLCYDGFGSATSGGTTYGEVKNASSIIINDLGNLSQGINATALIAGVSLEMCATQTPISFTNAGDGGIFTCSSVIVKANPDNSGEIIILFDSESTLPSLKVIVSAGNDITLKNYTDKVSISGNGTIQILSNNSVIATVQQNPDTEIDYSKSGSVITLNVTSGNATLTEGSSVSEISQGVVDEIQTAPQQPAQSGGDSGGSGGGGGGGCSVISWNCGEWGICSEETQSRTCTSNCGTKSEEVQECGSKNVSRGSEDILSFLRKGWEEEALSLMLNSLEEGLPDKVREAVFGKSCESCDAQRFIVLIWSVLSLLIIFFAWGARILHTRSLSEVEEVFD